MTDHQPGMIQPRWPLVWLIGVGMSVLGLGLLRGGRPRGGGGPPHQPGVPSGDYSTAPTALTMPSP